MATKLITEYGHYNIYNTGAYGVVYCNDEIAVKVIKYDDSATIQEISVINYLNHPNICKYQEIIYGETMYKGIKIKEYEVALVFPYYGETLNRYFDKEDLNINSLNTIVKQLINACYYMYHKNIINTDIKPSNICIKNNHITIIDFGLCSFSINQTKKNKKWFSQRGTAGYRYSDKNDRIFTSSLIWSLGSIMFDFFSNDNLYKYEKDIINKTFDYEEHFLVDYKHYLSQPITNKYTWANFFKDTLQINSSKRININKLAKIFGLVSEEIISTNYELNLVSQKCPVTLEEFINQAKDIIKTRYIFRDDDIKKITYTVYNIMEKYYNSNNPDNSAKFIKIFKCCTYLLYESINTFHYVYKSRDNNLEYNILKEIKYIPLDYLLN